MSEPLLVLGGPAVGKTHLAGQLYTRLRAGRSVLRLVWPAEDLRPFEEVLVRLEEGRTAGHTPVGLQAELRCGVAGPSGDPQVLCWPEYGGEQVERVIQTGQLPAGWAERLAASRAWLLMIRASSLQDADTALNQIDLLQRLLAATPGYTSDARATLPRLAIGLSAWDELPDGLTPAGWLGQRAPLLEQFVRSTWEPGAWSVWGLSSLGGAVDADQPSPALLAGGPERAGFLVRADGRRVEDLGLAVLWLLEGS